MLYMKVLSINVILTSRVIFVSKYSDIELFFKKEFLYIEICSSTVKTEYLNLGKESLLS